MEYRLEVDVGAFQFYLQDDDPEVGDFSESWSSQTVADRLAVVPRAIAIRPVRDMRVPLTIAVCEGEPDGHCALWDHITEASLEIRSGRLAIVGCFAGLEDAPRIPVTPGTYTARIYYGGLNTLRNKGIDGDDHYRVVLWPDGYRPPRVLKRWTRPR